MLRNVLRNALSKACLYRPVYFLERTHTNPVAPLQRMKGQRNLTPQTSVQPSKCTRKLNHSPCQSGGGGGNIGEELAWWSEIPRRILLFPDVTEIALTVATAAYRWRQRWMKHEALKRRKKKRMDPGDSGRWRTILYNCTSVALH